jgi:enoyl-CoA hydratase/carnithine racemase
MIAAVNGAVYGGGMEIVLNCDIVIASEEAKFALPEVTRGVAAVQGGLFQFICRVIILHLFMRLCLRQRFHDCPR